MIKNFQQHGKDEAEEGIHYVGERIVPNETPTYLYQEHVNRYVFAARFVRGKFVMDIGCGIGDGSNYLLKNGGAASVVGGDVSYEALLFLQKHYKQENLYSTWLSAESLPFRSEQFDIVVAFEVIEHLQDYEAFLAECRRVLKRNGLFVCSTPNKWTDLIWRSKPQGAFHVREFFPEQIIKTIINMRYQVEVFGQGPTTFCRRLGLSLFGFVSKLLMSIPNGISCRERFAAIVRKGFKVARAEDKVSQIIIDNRYTVLPFAYNCSFVIIAGKKL